jgi:hypothetical protein
MERVPFRVDTGEADAQCAFSCIADLFYLQEGPKIRGELLNSGHGERAHIGECIHCEVASIEE